MSRELNRNLQINLAFNYTKGKGYYEQYKKDENLSDYLIEPVIIGIDTLNSTDLIRRKWLDNELFVLNYSLDYNRDKIKAIIGGSIQNYFGKHYGNIVWARYAGDSEIDHQWYYNAGDKFEYNVYGKFEYLFLNKFNFYADLQFRQINYKILGMDENLRDLSQTHTFGFFNPKFGINYSIVDNQKAYFSFGVANREPSRTDFKDAIAGTEPKNETLNDFELGYTYTGQNIYFNLNFYYMNYKDQLVRTGKINDVGEAIFTNAPISFRKGIEVNSAVKLTKLLDWKFNATISSNKIKEYTEFIDNWDEGGQNENYIGESNLSFSPWLIVGNEFEINLTGGFRLAIQSKYVSKQYIDNSSTSDRMLDAYIVNNLRLNYHFETKYLKSIDLQFIINNLLNEAYETDAWVYRYYYENAYYNMDGYFPQAGRNFMVGMVLNF
jgi:iron complex outermembrane receptor protein